jgi:GT2 family glycosyltransferase
VSMRRISVIVSTYEWPAALDVVLRALADVQEPGLDLLVADDGSGPDTAEVIRGSQDLFDGGLRHVSQVDEGYRKARLLDLAALEAHGEYLVFLDGDCIPRRGFLRAVHRAALPGWFVSGKRVDLSPRLSRRVIHEGVEAWRWSTFRLLVSAPGDVRRPGLLVPLRDRRRPWRPGQAEFSPPYDAYGFFLGVFRSDFERVNGYDTRFVGWGDEDVDLAVRLRRSGLRCAWPGPDSTVLHLSHETRMGGPRPNKALLRETEASDQVEALEGLRDLAAQSESDVSSNRQVGGSRARLLRP